MAVAVAVAAAAERFGTLRFTIAAAFGNVHGVYKALGNLLASFLKKEYEKRVLREDFSDLILHCLPSFFDL